jgi:uncharacterized phiE125 gp8 family phage protein
MWNRLTCLQAGAAVLTLAQAKAQCRYEDTDQDDTFTALIAEAQAFVEGPRGAGVALLTQDWRLLADQWPCGPLFVPLTPIQSLTAVTYLDQTGTRQTLDPSLYVADLTSRPARIASFPGKNLPPVLRVPGAIHVDFVAGFGNEAASVDKRLIRAMLLLVNHWFENRSAVVGVENRDSSTELPLGVTALLAPYQLWV